MGFNSGAGSEEKPQVSTEARPPARWVAAIVHHEILEVSLDFCQAVSATLVKIDVHNIIVFMYLYIIYIVSFLVPYIIFICS